MATREEVLYNIFLDLHKDYDALDRDRCLGILTAYRVGPRFTRPLWRYWYHLTMMSLDGGQFGTQFNGFCGVTQVDPLSPTIFNIVVYAIIWH